MKVVAFNGSPRANGNTKQALEMVGEVLKKEGIEFEIVHVGNKVISGCVGCGMCFRNKDQKCILPGNEVNEWIQKMVEADGILFGSPVYFASMNATLKAFMDRAFYVGTSNDGLFRHKVGASVIAVRRSGGLPAYNEINNYLTYSEMIVPGSNYWNVIHGRAPGQVHEDEEGKQIMEVLGQNMAWLLKVLKLGKETIPAPAREKKVYMGFNR
jgi:multimeric flavodoxin WrbA